MIVYGYENGRTLRVIWALEEADAPYEYRRIDVLKGGQHAPEFVAINPFRKVPVLIDEDLILTESAAILSYIGEKYPQSKLIPPADTKERPHYDQWVSFILTEIDAPLWTIAKHRFVYPKAYRVPDAERGATRDLKEAFAFVAESLERQSSEKKFLVGGGFSSTDILLAHCVGWAISAKLNVDPTAVRLHYGICTERGSFKRASVRLRTLAPARIGAKV